MICSRKMTARWIEFEHGEAGSTKGDVVLETVVRGLIEGTA
jgi:hypothetical protein